MKSALKVLPPAVCGVGLIKIVSWGGISFLYSSILLLYYVWSWSFFFLRHYACWYMGVVWHGKMICEETDVCQMLDQGG